MINRVAAMLAVFGFLMTFGGVGGIENEGPLLENTIIALVGLALMGVGISLLKSASTKDNPTLW